jgi:hypothetical protein
MLLFARAVAPGRRELELDVYVLALGGLAILVLVSWLREIVPSKGQSELEDALGHRPAQPPRIAELDRLEREIYMGAARSFDLHYRLRPVIREIAGGKLERRGLSLDSGSDTVRGLLGDELWELVRPDREAPWDRQSAGAGVDEIRRTVERLERL